MPVREVVHRQLALEVGLQGFVWNPAEAPCGIHEADRVQTLPLAQEGKGGVPGVQSATHTARPGIGCRTASRPSPGRPRPCRWGSSRIRYTRSNRPARSNPPTSKACAASVPYSDCTAAAAASPERRCNYCLWLQQRQQDLNCAPRSGPSFDLQPLTGERTPRKMGVSCLGAIAEVWRSRTQTHLSGRWPGAGADTGDITAQDGPEPWGHNQQAERTGELTHRRVGCASRTTFGTRLGGSLPGRRTGGPCLRQAGPDALPLTLSLYRLGGRGGIGSMPPFLSSNSPDGPRACRGPDRFLHAACPAYSGRSLSHGLIRPAPNSRLQYPKPMRGGLI